MSYNFEGKIVNQSPTITNLTSAKTKCEKCARVIEAPTRFMMNVNDTFYLAFSYLDTDYFVYETKSGRAVAYCSEYCKSKHNHRFSK